MKITTAALTLAPETVEEAHHLRDAIDASLDVLEPNDTRRPELQAARDQLHHFRLNKRTGGTKVALTIGAVDHLHTALCMLAEWAEPEAGVMTDDEVELLEQLAQSVEGALHLAGELGQLLGRGASKCEGHPAGPSDVMGATKYCDGSCLSSRAA